MPQVKIPLPEPQVGFLIFAQAIIDDANRRLNK